MKKLSVPVALALALGLCTAPAAHAGPCNGGGDPVHDPGGTQPCSFIVSTANSGAESVVRGRYWGKSPILNQPSYVKDIADDGLDAHLWGRFITAGTPRDLLVASASGPGVTTQIGDLPVSEADAFYLRVCVGPDTTNCSDWTG